MEIKKMENKVKIILEYSTKLEPKFDIISEGKIKKLNIRIFLKNGNEIYDKDISYISWSAKE